MKFHFPTWEEAVKHDMYCFAKQVEKNRPKGVMINCTNLEHPMTPQLQTWAKDIVEIPCLRAGVDRVAIVRPAEASHWEAITVEEAKHRQYFDTEEEAQAWLDEAC